MSCYADLVHLCPSRYTQRWYTYALLPLDRALEGEIDGILCHAAPTWCTCALRYPLEGEIGAREQWMPSISPSSALSDGNSIAAIVKETCVHCRE